MFHPCLSSLYDIKSSKAGGKAAHHAALLTLRTQAAVSV